MHFADQTSLLSIHAKPPRIEKNDVQLRLLCQRAEESSLEQSTAIIRYLSQHAVSQNSSN